MSSPEVVDGVGGAPVPCAGGLVFDAQGRLLLIRRGTPPAQGRWSVPGGRVEPGETAEQACAREVLEETGLDVEVGHLAGSVHRDGPGGVVFAIDDFVCTVRGGTLQAATDAADARWVDGEQYREMERTGELVPQLTEALAGWDALPRG
jgi:8-oxo-dGTP diphosphatase